MSPLVGGGWVGEFHLAWPESVSANEVSSACGASDVNWNNCHSAGRLRQQHQWVRMNMDIEQPLKGN